MCYQWERYGTSAANLIKICYCIVVPQNQNYRLGWEIGSCESPVSYDFQNLLTIFVQFLQKYIWKQLQFLSHWNNVQKNGTFSLFETSQWNRDICINYDISLYQRIPGNNELCRNTSILNCSSISELVCHSAIKC